MPQLWQKKAMPTEVVQFTRDSIDEVVEFIGDKGFLDGDEIVLHTLEGDHRATYGAYIVKGVEDEVWPVKQSIFEKTYERVR